jgi:hypothetical protein
VLDHRVAIDFREGLAREAGRTEPGGDDGDRLERKISTADPVDEGCTANITHGQTPMKRP